MGFKIISGRDKEGNFLASSENWHDEKIETLLLKYNPHGKMWYQKKPETKDAPAPTDVK